MIEGILIEGLIYGCMVLGVFVTFRVLNFADMTVDGSFPLGGAVLAVLLLNGAPPAAAVVAAAICGMLAGLVTALIHTRLNVPDLLAGILTMTMLYSVNLRIMSNRANISLLRVDTVFTWAEHVSASLSIPSSWGAVLLLASVLCAVKLLLDVFFHTDFGLTMGALGANPQMIISQGMNPAVLKTAGIMLGNALAAVSGAFASMYNGFADVGSGTGVVVSGLASLMLGEFLLRSNRIGIQTLRVLIGSIIYRGLMYFARSYGYAIGMSANDLKLITGVLIILCLIISQIQLVRPQRRKGGV